MPGGCATTTPQALDPKSMAASGAGAGANGKKTKLLTVPMLNKEVAKMKAHIESLEKKLKANNISHEPFKSDL